MNSLGGQERLSCKVIGKISLEGQATARPTSYRAFSADGVYEAWLCNGGGVRASEGGTSSG